MLKKIPAFVLFATLGAAVGLSAIAANPASAGESLDCGKIKNADVKKACTDEKMDENAMKKQMKAWMKVAKDNGWEGKCGTCHKDGTKGGPLTPEAADEWPKFAKAAKI